MLKKGETIGFQIKEGPCSAGCDYCYERPTALAILKKAGQDLKHLNNREIAKKMVDLGFEFSLDEFKHYFTIFQETGINETFIIGSEPTDVSEYDKVLNLAEEHGLKLTIYTSGKRLDKLTHSVINHIILHVESSPTEEYMNKIHDLMNHGKTIDLRINFADKSMKEKDIILSFYSKLKDYKKIILKYSFSTRVNNSKSAHFTPDNFPHRELINFIDELQAKFPEINVKAERSLFRCNFSDEEWKLYSVKGGFRSKCTMDFTVYPKTGLSYCPPARDLIKPSKIENTAQLQQKLNELRKQFYKKKFSPSFKICEDCEFRTKEICQGGCGGYYL